MKKEYSESGQAGYSDCHIICSFQIIWRLVVTVTVLWRLVVTVTVLCVSDHVASSCHAYCVVAFRSCSVWLSRLLCCGFQIMRRLVVTFIVGDRLKPRNSVFPVLRKTKQTKNVLKIKFFNTRAIVSTYVCCYDFTWRKRISYERFLLEHEVTCFLSLTPDP